MHVTDSLWIAGVTDRFPAILTAAQKFLSRSTEPAGVIAVMKGFLEVIVGQSAQVQRAALRPFARFIADISSTSVDVFSEQCRIFAISSCHTSSGEFVRLETSSLLLRLTWYCGTGLGAGLCCPSRGSHYLVVRACLRIAAVHLPSTLCRAYVETRTSPD